MRFQTAITLALADMEAELSPTAMPTWRSHARKALEYWQPDREIETVTRRDVQAWINDLKTRVKGSTVRHYLSFLKWVWKVAEDLQEDKDLPYPFHRLKVPKRNSEKRRCDAGTYEAVRAMLTTEQAAPIEVARQTCMRRLEIFRLTAADVRFIERTTEDGRRLELAEVRLVTSKTGVGRVVPCNPKATQLLKERITAAEAAGVKHLFGKPLADRFKAACLWSQSVWKKAVKKVGDVAHFHGLRHLGAHSAYNNGAKVETISKLLGHSTIAQTEHYIGIKQDAAWEAAFAVGLGSGEARNPLAIFDRWESTPPRREPPKPGQQALRSLFPASGPIGLLARPPGLAVR